MSRLSTRDAITIASLLAFAVGLIGLLEFARQRKRTVYHGRTLTEWLAALHDPRADVRDTAAYALTRLVPGSPAELPAVIEGEARVLGDTDEEVRSEATAALITLGPGSDHTVPAVVLVLSHNASPSARMHAAQVLGALGQGAQPAIPALVDALSDSSASVRLVSVSALAQIGLPDDQLGIVARVTTDRDADVRAAAIESLMALHAPAAVLGGIGERALRDPDAVVRVQAAYALATVLAHVGPEAGPAAGALERAAADSDREVRAVATQSLRAVRRMP